MEDAIIAKSLPRCAAPQIRSIFQEKSFAFFVQVAPAFLRQKTSSDSHW